MMEPFLDFLRQYADLDEQEAILIQKRLPVQTIQKGTYLLREGMISNAFYFLLSGCIRLFYNVDGQEKSAFFYTENQFVSSYESFVRKKAAKHNLQAIEDSQMVIISDEAANQLLVSSPKFEKLARIILEEELIIYQEIIASFITLSPEERYLLLFETKPEWFNRISQQHIASYIGINAESLSRIKKRILLKKKKS